MEDKKALVTGAAGFMGQQMCETLLKQGWEVRGTDLPSADTEEVSQLDLEFHEADLTDKESLDGLTQDIDTVFHTAALFSYSSLIEWRKFEEINVHGTENLLEEIMEEGDAESMVHWSTSGVYGTPKDDLLPVTEDHPKNPESKYDLSKWLQEKAALKYQREYGFDVKCIRPVPVYGPGNMYGAAQVFLGVANGMIGFYPKYSDHKFALVNLEDVIHAAIHVDEEGESGESYNVVDNQDYEMQDVLEYVAQLTDQTMLSLPVGDRFYRGLSVLRHIVPVVEMVYDRLDEEPPVEKDSLLYLKGNYWISNEKLLDTGYGLRYPSYEEGVAETIEWYREQGLI